MEDQQKAAAITRRSLALATLAAGAVSLTARAEARKPATFVLVHGAWHGGWCWDRVGALLRARGHVVYTPTLTGLADRSHLFSADINLSTHVADVVNLITWEELEDLVLCGHSYGGMVITGVAAALATRIRSIVYLDAFLPGDGQSLLDLGETDDLKSTIAEASRLGGIGLPPISATAFGVNEADRARVDRLCTNQPLATFVEANKSSAGLAPIRRKHYVLATGYMNGGLFRWAHDKVRNDPAWTTEIVPCGHDVMIDRPGPLADSLERAAA